MVAKKKETAEQKLLKMIEASSGSGGAANKTHEKVVKKKNVLITAKIINKILIVVMIISALWLTSEIKNGVNFLKKDTQFFVGKKGNKDGVNALFPESRDISFYLSSIKKRNIFKPYEEKKKESSEQAADTKSVITEKTENFRLVGISWLDRIETASVMIEDTEREVTYFLQKGERIGNIIVKTIYADSALLGYENEEMIIKYDKSQM